MVSVFFILFTLTQIRRSVVFYFGLTQILTWKSVAREIINNFGLRVKFRANWVLPHFQSMTLPRKSQQRYRRAFRSGGAEHPRPQ